mmetsp:Transcript_8887/g.13671  ORF Transcript_8887/g.13671 Transcript_8887/m.13671 type:complete len:436 (-) Transcript_8887:481-1788(-)|eukprot:CAMPEP_0178898640 /NCGR_PEP_ID=MMETSP0786-20121207/2451_1 /TAXON_ID=186022 /ORGANISM="Thalassionema frauenfeldii, Strain CCMP 1798" /LENGTH=435 /DNA_ID=CAMNT_0020569397 /DNA_START=37 /DNA_END=1344 /DNA_ORIENTATION=-
MKISDDLRILADSSTSQEERRAPFIRLQRKFSPNRHQRVGTEQDYAKEVARVFSLRFPIWPAPPVHVTHFYPRCRHRLSDAIRGCIYGAALGDAMGIATEFLSRKTVELHYDPDFDFLPGSKVYSDMHRLSFAPGDWTDDTDHLILTLQSLLETGGKVDAINFAQKLVQWVENGFPELGDEGGTGLGQTTKRVVRSKGYHLDPAKVAKDMWMKGGKKAAPNGALMRTAVIGIATFWDLDVVERNAVSLCQATHADPRCIASCVAVSCCVALLLQAITSAEGDDHHDLVIDIEALVNESIGRAFSASDCCKEQEEEFQSMVNAGDISLLHLDCPESMGYTFRCAACSIITTKCAQQNSLSFLDAMKKVVREGGDADTNAAVAGALVGCMRGYSCLPKQAISAMPNVAWLEAWTQKLLFMLRLPVNAENPKCKATEF